jgi:hypothetical protein
MNTSAFDVSVYGQDVNPNRIPMLSSVLIGTYGYLFGLGAPTEYISNHAARTVGLLIEQFRRERPLINAYITAIAKQCQEVEDALFDLLRFRSIGTANAAQLDEIGAIVGLARTGGDDLYRSDLYFQVFLNNSNGEPETIIAAAQRITKAMQVLYDEVSPARIIITLRFVLGIIQNNFPAKMKTLKAGGVALQVQINNYQLPFIFSELIPYPAYIAGAGFGETNHSEIGGQLTELLTSEVS